MTDDSNQKAILIILSFLSGAIITVVVGYFFFVSPFIKTWSTSEYINEAASAKLLAAELNLLRKGENETLKSLLEGRLDGYILVIGTYKQQFGESSSKDIDSYMSYVRKYRAEYPSLIKDKEALEAIEYGLKP